MQKLASEIVLKQAEMTCTSRVMRRFNSSAVNNPDLAQRWLVICIPIDFFLFLLHL
jgi:hypothetical protein